jgi:hypothetical protein
MISYLHLATPVTVQYFRNEMFKISEQEVNLNRHASHLLLDINSTTKSGNVHIFVANIITGTSV